MEPQQFVYCSQDFISGLCRTRDGCSGFGSPPTKFDTTLQTGWKDRMSRGLFRYHLGDLQTKVLPGPHRYVAQLNVQRGIERRKPQEILSIQQPFNAKQFNFNKINPAEIMFEMTKNKEQDTAFIANGQPDEQCRIFVVVNVSPLEFGHCLLIPEPSHCLPQILTPFAIQTGIESVFLSSDPGFRVGFNSLGGFASVNHLHLHGYYLSQELKIESAPVKSLVPEKGFFRLTDSPTAFLFYAESEDVEKVAFAVCQITDFLVDKNTAHNLFFTRGCSPWCPQHGSEHTSRRGVRILIWPRVSCFGAKEESAFNVAICELAGHLPFKNKQDYDQSTEKDVMDTIQKYLLPDDEILELEKQLIALLQN